MLKRDPEAVLKRVLTFLKVNDSNRYVQRCLQANTFERLAGGRRPGEVDPTSFFRKGIVGDWRNHFSEENIVVFKQVAGNTLITAGYEEDDQWGL